MDKETSTTPVTGGLATRALHWLDERTGVKAITRKLLDEPIPGGARFAYVFGSGLLFIFLLQVITGVSLALYYTPTAETAHTSVAYIFKQVSGGAFLRSLHSYGSSAMIIVLGLHFLQTFLFGSFKGRRELLWCSGALLSFLVLGMGFTGYLLPWDQKAYFATAVGTNIVGQMPVVGGLLTRLLRGGDSIGTLTLSRFYLAHVFLIPASIFLFIAAHVFLFRKAGPAGPVSEDPLEPKLATETFYPRQVLLDMGFVLLIVAVLAGLSYLRPVTLGPIANPADTHFLPRPEWYYLPMFEWLKFWEGPRVVLGVVVIPGLLAMAFFLMPFLDRRLERKPWRRPIPALAVAVVVAGMVFLGVKSRIDDKQGPNAAQLALQHDQEEAYSAAPFQPFVESPDGVVAVSAPAGPINPMIAQGKGIFTERGCSGCHGPVGSGTPAAPSLVGVTGKFGQDQLIALLRNPNPRMRAGRMPSVDASPADMSALLAWLAALGTSAQNVPAVYHPLPASPVTSPSANRLIAMQAVGSSGTMPGGSSSQLPASIAGRQFFQERACFACHGQAGAGGRAPALAPLVAHLSNPELTRLLQDPNAKMQAGGMPPVTGTPEEISLLVSYLRTLPAPPSQSAKTPATNLAVRQDSPVSDTPAAPLLASVALAPSPATSNSAATLSATPDIDAGRALFKARGCIACHGSNAQGTRIAPALIGVGSRFPGEKLPALLRQPTSKMLDGGMPAVAVNDEQMRALVAYLTSLEPASAARPIARANTDPPAATVQPVAMTSEGDRFPRLHETVSASLSPLAQRGRQIFQRNTCGACHGSEGVDGTVAAPGLAGTASMLPAPMLEGLLKHYSAQMRKGGMPPTNFNAKQMEAVVAYIRSMSSPPGEHPLLASGSAGQKN